MLNDERHFLISTTSLRLYSKLVYFSDFSSFASKAGGISLSADAAAGLSTMLNEVALDLLGIKELNEQIVKNSGVSNTTDTVQE
jgi:hypothetical protein